MAGIKVTMMFSSEKYSWTEAHYYITTSQTAPAAAVGPAQQLAQMRAPLLGLNASLDRIRLSSYPANRIALDLEDFFLATKGNWPADPGQNTYSAALANVALVLRISSLEGFSTQVYLAGIPMSVVRETTINQDGWQFSSSGDFGTRLQAFAGYLTGGLWGWLTQQRTPYVQVQGLVTNAAFPGMVGVVTAGPLGTLLNPQNIPVNTQVRMRNWRRLCVRQPRLSGVWFLGGILTPVAPSTLWTYFLFNSGQVPLTNYKSYGQIGLLTPGFATYQAATASIGTTRKRGATSNRPRGRARSRV
jgi:hypothetical protein